MLSQWHSCPQDVLQHSFSNQPDYSDNAAAACACTAWRAAFVSVSRASTLVYGGVRTDASPSYLQQHTSLTSLTLVNLSIWDNAQSWLHVAHDPFKQHSIALSTWSETLSKVSATCKQLTLDHSLLEPNHTFNLQGSVLYQTFSQFSVLQHLTLYENSGRTIAIEALSGLLGLRTLEVSGKLDTNKVRLAGPLSALPSSITRLQLHDCGPCYPFGAFGFGGAPTTQNLLQLKDLAHLQSLQDLDLNNSAACFSRVALSGLSLLTRLICRDVSPFVSLHNDILPLTGLRALSLRHAIGTDSSVPLGVLLRRLSCLQKLDILECPGIVITPADCQHLGLLSFAFDVDMLSNINESSFDRFLSRGQPADLDGKPVLKMYCENPRFHMQHPVIPKLFHDLTHLRLTQVASWPAIFGRHEVGLPLLRLLEVSYNMLLNTSDVSVVALSPQLNLAVLCIADSCNSSFDLALCTSLRSISITHRGPNKPAIGLPPFLTRLRLHNLLSASFHLQLNGLQDLLIVELSGKVASTDVTRQLPSLPQSVTKLDLWDGSLTDLRQLSRLTNLQKLLMPDAPNEQQLQIIRQLRQLRHVEVTGHEDILTEDGRPEAPWLYH